MWKENDNQNSVTINLFGRMLFNFVFSLFEDKWVWSHCFFLSSSRCSEIPTAFRDDLRLQDLGKKNNSTTASVRVCKLKRDHKGNSELSLSSSSQRLRTTFFRTRPIDTFFLLRLDHVPTERLPNSHFWLSSTFSTPKLSSGAGSAREERGPK